MAKKSLSKEELTEQLKALATAEIPKTSLHRGAMCYSPAPPDVIRVKCESCGSITEKIGWDSTFRHLKRKVAKIADMGYDAKLEILCSNCINKLGLRNNDGEEFGNYGVHTVFYFKTKEQSEYTVSVDNCSSCYDAVIAFLENKAVYADSYDATHPVKDRLDDIRRMTGISVE